MSNRNQLEAQLDQLIEGVRTGLWPRPEIASVPIGSAEGRRPVLFGAGALGRTVLQGLRQCGVEPLCFVDNNPLRWGSSVDGLPVMSLAEAHERHGRDVPIVVTIYTNSDVEAQLREAKVVAITFPQLALKFPQELLPRGALDLPSRMARYQTRIREAFSLWADDQSREEFFAQIRFRCTFNGPMPPHLPAQTTYFPSNLVSLEPDEVFVDCGAYDGDSVISFLKRSGGWFRGVVAIEADPQSVEKLRQFVSRLPAAVGSKIRVVEAAVGSRNETVRFRATGTAASNLIDGQGTTEVSCRKLDDILEGVVPSYIKMDVEGAEPEALAGGREIIGRHAPVLAVCLYHRQSDIWEIPLQIRDMTDRYSFYLRRYSNDCWEQILYAIPHQRIRKSPQVLDRQIPA